jgi:Mg2+/citrate symporter
VTGSFTVLVWIFNGTGGSLVVALPYHASLNLAAGPLQFDPGDLVAPLLTWLVVGLLVVGYGARDLARQQRFTWQQRPARYLLAAWPTRRAEAVTAWPSGPARARVSGTPT